MAHLINPNSYPVYSTHKHEDNGVLQATAMPTAVFVKLLKMNGDFHGFYCIAQPLYLTAKSANLIFQDFYG